MVDVWAEPDMFEYIGIKNWIKIRCTDKLLFVFCCIINNLVDYC